MIKRTIDGPTDERFGTVDLATPVGVLTLVASAHGLRAILWPDDVGQRVKIGPTQARSTPVLEEAAGQLDQYFQGDRLVFDLPLDPVGTKFQVGVWQSLTDVGYGRTRTYGQQADALGNPNGTRAVASANGKNPISVVLPCHRIIGADGTLTGFAGGLQAKAWLLDHERRTMGRAPKWSSNTLF